jgi:hypothetical protein
MNKLINLTEEQRERLLSEHKKYRKVTGNTNLAYRINAILLLDDGLTPTAVARCLLLDDGTVKSYADKFQSGEDKELLALCYHGRSCNLNGEQQQELKIHISSKIYLSVAPIIAYVLHPQKSGAPRGNLLSYHLIWTFKPKFLSRSSI